MIRLSGLLAFLLVAVYAATPARSAVVIKPQQAAIRTEGGPMADGGWNLWSDGQVGQALRIATAGTYTIVVRAWGSPAAGVWPEMAIMVDGRAAATATVGLAQPRDYRFNIEISGGVHEIAVAFLNDAIIGREDRNLYLGRITINPPAGAPDPSLPRTEELLEAAEIQEREVLAATESAIDKNRKGDARIRVVDAAGRPVSGARIAVEQTQHDFLFGCNIYGFDHGPDESHRAAYKKRFEELFNYATVGFYWRWYEPERGKPDYATTDKVVAWCRDRGIRLKGHPLLWGDEAGIPTWSHGQPSPDVQRRRVLDIMNRYRGKIDFWEVVNEPSHQPQPKIEQPYRWARQADPKAYLIVNDYHVLADGCPGFFQLLTDAARSSVPFDGIGIQAHEPRLMRFPLDRVRTVLDQYAALGKELHITEFTPTSHGQKIIDPYRTGIWDEAAQAAYAVRFYRVCFAHPAIRAITWWDLCDGQSWLPGGGILRKDMTPKPVYHELERLIHHEWKTRLSGATDDAGRFSFRGFYGQYRLTIAVQDRKMGDLFRLEKGGRHDITIALP